MIAAATMPITGAVHSPEAADVAVVDTGLTCAVRG
jgi:hypothetical protein